MNIEFHFGIEVNDTDFLWLHGSVGDHCFRWTLRKFWQVMTWTIDDFDPMRGQESLAACIEEIPWDTKHENLPEERPMANDDDAQENLRLAAEQGWETALINGRWTMSKIKDGQIRIMPLANFVKLYAERDAKLALQRTQEEEHG